MSACFQFGVWQAGACRGQMEVRAAMQWMPRRTMTEAWRRKQDHYAREARDSERERL